MATIPRTYLVTSKNNLSNIEPKNGQVIAVYDSDEVYYDVSASGSAGAADDIIRRKISGVKVITDATLPENPEEDVVYVYIGNHGLLPSGDALYDVRVWYDGAWYVVGTNNEDSHVKTVVSDDKFYLVGTSDIADNAIGSLLKNSKIYFEESNGESVIYADRFSGTVDHADYANAAGVAASATAAEQDSEGRALTQYIWEVTKVDKTNGTQLYFHTGDPASFPTTDLFVPDTKYSVFSTSNDGLVPMPIVSATSPDSDLILFGNGWQDKDTITIGTADKANADINGNPIIKYVKSISYDTITDILTVTDGEGTTNSVSIPNTEYPNYSGVGIAGLVPPANSSQLGYFLRGDGTWQEITIVTYGVFTTTTNGLVPAPGAVNGLFLRDDHSWATPVDTKNTVGSTNSNGQLLIVGAGSQSPYTQSYTNTGAYIDNGILYSQGLQVVNLGQDFVPFDVTAAYAVNDTCKYLNVYYKCTQAISATPTGAYSEVTEYAVNDTCVYENVIYQCINAISYPGAAAYDDTSTSYSVGNLCFYDDRTYSCTEAIQAPAGDFDDTLWEVISEFDPDNWQEIKSFNVADWAIVAGQSLYNKTYEGYTLGDACEHFITESVDVSDNVPTSAAVNTAINDAISGLNLATDAKADKDTIAADYSATKSGGYSVGEYCYYNDDLYRCTTAQPQGAFVPADWELVILTDVVKSITVKVPEPPTTNGTYYLKAEVSGGSVTYSWATLS